MFRPILTIMFYLFLYYDCFGFMVINSAGVLKRFLPLFNNFCIPYGSETLPASNAVRAECENDPQYRIVPKMRAGHSLSVMHGLIPHGVTDRLSVCLFAYLSAQ